MYRLEYITKMTRHPQQFLLVLLVNSVACMSLEGSGPGVII